MITIQFIVETFGDILQILIPGIVLIYSPFAKNWARALIIPTLTATVWSIIRIFCIIAFPQAFPPLGGFVVFPFFVLCAAALLRFFKNILFSAPVFRNIKERAFWKI